MIGYVGPRSSLLTIPAEIFMNGCPDPETLEKLLRGKLPAAETEAVGAHLLECPRCLQLAETLPESDDLTAAIRACRPYSGDEQRLAEAVERGKRLRGELETVRSGATRESETGRWEQGTGRQAPPVAPVPLDFLHPPEQPDELGRLGGYRVFEVMGVGGMGVVLRAEDPRLMRPVAIKVMKPLMAATQSAKERFLREARATAAIDHDHIVHIYQVGEDGDVPFIAMQYLLGESLRTRLERETKLEISEVLRIGREIATGLAAAHKRGLVHRDVKPDNIWLDAESGRVKILDFGLVRGAVEDDELTQSGTVLGTPRYMAPEQALGEHVDSRSDLFSLGSVLYHAVTGRLPFSGSNLTATLVSVAYQDPPPVERFNPAVSPGLARLIASLLAKDPARRPRTAVEVAQTLAELEGRAEASPHGKAHRAEAGRSSTKAIDVGPATETLLPVSRRRRGIPVHGLTALALVALGLLGLWAAGIILRVETPDGTVLVEVDGAGEPFEIDVTREKVIRLEDPRDGLPITVRVQPGAKQLQLEKAGFQIETRGFSLESPDGRKVKVSFVPRPTSTRPVTAGDPNVLTVAQDGSGQFTTIADALQQARAGTVVRVIDDAVYRETLVISSPSRHADLTLEAAGGATLEHPSQGMVLLLIRGVPRVTIRGFTMRFTKAPAACCVAASCTGLKLENLKFVGDNHQATNAISLEGLNAEPADALNAVIRHCRFQNLGLGIRISGIQNDYVTPMTCRRILVADNSFDRLYQAITLGGDVREVTIAGNRLTHALETGIQLQNLVGGAGDMRILNNTMFSCVGTLQLWDTTARGKSILVANNLTLSPDGPDWIFLDNGGSPHIARGPGDGRSVREAWQLTHNWREVRAADHESNRAWIVPGDADVLGSSLAVLSRDPDNPEFLRPAEQSPLATQGAGQERAGLPPYVGAVPPPGTNAWEWER